MADLSFKKKLSHFPSAEIILYCMEDTSVCFVFAFEEKSLTVRVNTEVYESLIAF